MASKLPELEDDGLITPEVGEWAEEKYRLVSLYAELFTRVTKGRWGNRVYIDLFSGAGRARIKGTNKIFPASPLLALGVADQFDRYILSEIEPKKISALEDRVRRDYPGADAHFVAGDTNENIGEIMRIIPQHHPGRSVLCFCFVDPYRMKHLNFETIRRLAGRLVDFLVLIPSGMDANRNVAQYTKEESSQVARFLGMEGWRARWLVAEAKGENFERFVRDQFGRQMAALGYKYSGPEEMKPIRLPEKNVLLYRLAFFSRSDLGKKLWEQVRKYGDDQRSLF